MNKRTSLTAITVIDFTFAFSLLYFGLIISKKNYNSNILSPLEIFAQEENELPVVKNSKVMDFSGVNYADVVNSRDINLDSFTVSTWFNTNMNVTGRDVAFLINKGGLEQIDLALTLITVYGLTIEKELMEDLRLQQEMIII